MVASGLTAVVPSQKGKTCRKLPVGLVRPRKAWEERIHSFSEEESPESVNHACQFMHASTDDHCGAGEVVSERGYKEFKLGDYSNWLQKRVNNTKNWNNIKSCLIDSKVCKSLVDQNVNKNSGCCKPPTSCKFTYVTLIEWTNPSNTTSFTDSDYTAWNNNENDLCYNCQSCKGGVLQNIKSQWKKVAIVNIIFLIFLVIVYTIGCCAFRNNRMDNSYPRYKGYP
ncbi:tetraspanin-8-like [Telopea speciosissima]|uniref:tetraspanin-8-like n=1 Tax=Telopea speciosissima TaxID=54955 RepID=UPI001CC59FFA|nr:tetraspanin-8-like [Telopea speciosissima]